VQTAALVSVATKGKNVTGTPVTTAYTVRGKRGSDLCSWITQERIMKTKEKITRFTCVFLRKLPTKRI
jgi:hypothetical protein